MRRSAVLGAVLGAAVLGLVATALVVRSRVAGSCSESLRLDRILGGGAPICLGEASSQLDRYGRGATDPSSCNLVQQGPSGEYWYVARHADARCRQEGPVVAGCVALHVGANADSTVRAAAARLGGKWQLTLHQTPLGWMEQTWTSAEGFEISQSPSFDGSRTVCVRDRRPGPRR